MADLPILDAANPEIIPEKTYDRVWVEELVIRGPDPNGDITGEVKLRKYGMFNDVAEFEPGNGKWITVNNMLEKADSSPSLAAAMSGIIAYVTELGVENEVITPPSV